MIKKIIQSALLLTLLMANAVAKDGNALHQVLVIGGEHFNADKYYKVADLGQQHDFKLEVITLRALAGKNPADLIADKDLVILHTRGAESGAKNFAAFKALQGKLPELKMVALNWQDESGILQNLTLEQAEALLSYINNGTQVNFERMADYLAYILSEGQTAKPEVAKILPVTGIFHPDAPERIFASLAEYVAFKGEAKPGQPTIGIAFNRAEIEREQTQVVIDLIRCIEAQGARVLPYFSPSQAGLAGFRHLVTNEAGTVIDNIITFQTIHMASARKKDFDELGVPVLLALRYRSGDQAAWEADMKGISPTMTPFFLSMPEAAGVIDPLLVSAKGPGRGEPDIIGYQMQSLAEKAVNLATLKHKANADKQVAVMFWNTPAGKQNIGAAFLNVPRSLEAISQALQDEGYQTQAQQEAFFIEQASKVNAPFYGDYDLEALLAEDLAELLPLADYLSWYATLPEDVRTAMEAHWGKPEQAPMVVERQGSTYFVVPRIKLGNVIVLRQPPRGYSLEKEQELYHSMIVPVDHYYLAAYLYVRKQFKADALVHLGTHGTQEWLPGKERALSIYDSSLLSVGEVPVVYPFIVDDVGEAMQTKRRGRAVSLAHATPPFATAGLQIDLSKVQELISRYEELDQGQVKTSTGESIVERCFELNLCEELDFDRTAIDKDFEGFLMALHVYIEDLASELQPLGLHTYGLTQPSLYVLSTVTQMLDKDFIEQAKTIEPKAEQPYTEEAELMAQPGMKTLQQFLVDKTKVLSDYPEAMQPHLELAQDYFEAFHAQQELPNLLKAIAGQHIPVRSGGDPVRTPDSLPTGFNLYGFDPAKVPTQEAWNAGKKLLDEAVENYRVKHGELPDKMAFSLWSIETMRHYGVLEAQAMYAMGVRPVWSEGGYVTGTEVIPYQELGRPRIDVVLSATGLYRDAFPNVMLMLADAVDQIARMKEPYNHLYENAQRLRGALMEQGVEEAQADKLSTMRVFSNESGNYGTGLEGAALASDTWETDSKLAELYLNRMGYAFGKDTADWGVKPIKGLKLYDQVLSGTDITLLARSSNVFGMLSSDDPFQYLGGLSLAVRNLDGQSPDMMIANLRNPRGIKVERAEQFLAKELRSRNLHKRWVGEMQEEGYAGANEMRDNIDNLWGWEVMDPELVADAQWQELHEIYVNDKLEMNINEWFEQVNPQAQAALIERMIEVVRKEYWDASDETLKQMVERYLELRSRYDYQSENKKLEEFVSGKAQGYGLAGPLLAALNSEAAAAAEPAAAPSAASQAVEGMKLEQVQAETAETDYSRYYWLLLCLLAFVVGMAKQKFKPEQA